jgi:tRNA(Ile)-lysidine synthase
MPGPAPAVAATRHAVRAVLAELTGDPGAPEAAGLVLVACSGGADSLALAAAVAFEAPKLALRAGAIVVDHGLQRGSARVARDAAAACIRLGLAPAEVVRVQVPASPHGPEAAARDARYAALSAAADRLGALAVLLGHTRDDQAEQVLLGLARGSGARSLAGMPARRDRFRRPFLVLGRVHTEAACAAYGIVPWQDPHNADPAYARVRARGALAALEQALGPGIADALARSAYLLREDADLLEEMALVALRDLGEGPVPVAALANLPSALRRRVLRLLALQAGVPRGSLTGTHVAAMDALVVGWHGQGAVDLPGQVRAARDGPRLRLTSRRVG